MSSAHLPARLRHPFHPVALVSITSVPLSPDQEYDARRRRYAVMMSIRIACVIAAVLVSSVSLLAALLLMVGGAVLPWCAVLIANDRLPTERHETEPVTTSRRAITAAPESYIEL